MKKNIENNINKIKAAMRDHVNITPERAKTFFKTGSGHRSFLLTLAKSEVLWERRIAIVSTWYFIRNDDVKWTFKIANILLKDKEDLIHKAVGWMLREAGKRNQTALITFLDQHANQMPRTMLRYAIEKFSESVRKSYLNRRN